MTNQRIQWTALGTLLIGSLPVAACTGEDFNSCEQTRTCVATVSSASTGGSAGTGAVSPGGKGGAASAGEANGGKQSGGESGSDGASGGTAGVGSGATAGGDGGASGAVAGGSGGASPGGSGGATATCDAMAAGIHVSALGGNDTPATGTCGTAAQPCKSVSRALVVAKQNGVDTITLSKGTFEEDDLLVDFSVRIQGGFSEIGGEWSAKCDAARRTLTTIRPKTKAKSLSVNGGDVTLEALTVTSRTSPAAAGESLYGVFATGATTKLSLVEVTVDVADAGDAVPTPKAPDGNAPAVAGSCPASNGAVGANGTPAVSNSKVTFGADGASGTKGQDGDSGKPGSATAQPPQSCAAGCVEGCSADYDSDSGKTFCSTMDTPRNACYSPLVGCGGGGGSAGKGGSVGGSAIALFAWESTVHLDGSQLHSGPAGDGGDGGLPGSGVAGNRDPKASISCGLLNTSERSYTSCTQRADFSGCYDASTLALTPPTGGKGGDGSRGGGGAGGHSYGAYVGGGGKLTQTGSKITVGAAGKGGAGATQAGTGPGGVAKAVGP